VDGGEVAMDVACGLVEADGFEVGGEPGDDVVNGDVRGRAARLSMMRAQDR
jgi:hypothetical protein